MLVLLLQLIEIFHSSDPHHHQSRPRLVATSIGNVHMKSSKRDPSSNAQKSSAGGKRSSSSSSSSAHKAGGSTPKLDRKSSRGMIYENEELRLRTININAEVERGQSDIRKLRRENEQLRREIWSLRDEYDRLNKRFKANKYLPDSISEHGQSESNSEDSDSCDTCRGEGDSNDECLVERKQHSFTPPPSGAGGATTDATYERCTGSGQEPGTFDATDSSLMASSAPKTRDNLHVLFDHLSIVSEENLSSSDGNLTQADACKLSPSRCLGAMSLPSLVGPATPLTPIELVANQLNDLQSIVPPLSYFENIVKQHSTIDSSASTNTGETVIHTNGWDYNIQSPFSARKFQPSDVSSSNSTSTTMSPSSHVTNPVPARESSPLPQPDVSTNPNSSEPAKPLKHFFSPIKPRLKLDTALAARAAILYPDLTTQPKYDPPDVYITNALASPYYPQSMAGLSLPSAVLVPPMQHAPPSYVEPIYATAQKKPQPSSSSDHSQSQSQSQGAESSKSSVNLEQILNEIGTISEDILQLQLEKTRSQERLLADNQYLSGGVGSCCFHTTATTHTQTASSSSSPPTSLAKEQPSQGGMPSDKNLPLAKSAAAAATATGTATATTTVAATAPSASGDCPAVAPSPSEPADAEEAPLPDREGNSPSPPQLPTPMAPFPTNLMYLAFDRITPALVDGGDLRYGLASSLETVQPPPPPPSPPPPAALPPFSYQSGDPIGFRIRDQDALNPALALSSPDLSTSPLAAIAPLKRRIFAKQHDDGSGGGGGGSSQQITRSFDGGDVTTKPSTSDLTDAAKAKAALEASANEISSYESSSGSEATKRKSSRRVSIVCRDDNRPDATTTTTMAEPPLDQHQSTVSVDRLDEMMPSILANLKAHAHSTPNSPHSNRRRGNTNSAISAASSTLHHHGHHHHHHHHHHNSRKLSQESINEATTTTTTTTMARGPSVANSIVNSSPDNVAASVHQHAPRYKCSRRHSDGTVASVVGAAGGGGGGGGVRLSGTSSHHHHHHHADSTHETATSISERNSGSLASSRESSTSLSMRSQRRKISVSSHTGGKIPWCGCWGNGCL